MSSAQLAPSMPLAAGAKSFPEATPLNAFFEWNEARRFRDPRYRIACDVLSLAARLGGAAAAREACIAHLAGAPATSPTAAGAAAARLVDRLLDAVGSPDIAAHAAVFAAFEALAAQVDLAALARRRPAGRPAAARSGPARILVIKLGALGDFVQSLGTVPAIRENHQGAHLSLLTTAPYAAFARRTGLFDAVLVDRRPAWFDIVGWLGLARMLRAGRFDRVYDLQTSDRSSAYALLLRGGPTPQWSGIAWRCSHPHANRNRDRLHTLDRQAEQLLMAGIYPVPLAGWLPPLGAAPPAGVEPPFALLIPGSSPGRLGKRWPAERYGELAMELRRAGYQPVVVGVAGEEAIAGAIRNRCPATLDLVGRTDLVGLAALARDAALTVGNDTGATHIAAAGGNPVLVLFSRASAPELCAPRGAGVRILAAADLADLPVAEVAAAAAALASPSGPA